MARCASKHCTLIATGIWRVRYIKGNETLIATRFLCASCAMTIVARTGLMWDEQDAVIGNVELIATISKKPQTLAAGNLKPLTDGKILPEPIHAAFIPTRALAREDGSVKVLPDIPKMFCAKCDKVTIAYYIVIQREGRPDQHKARCMVCKSIGPRPREE